MAYLGRKGASAPLTSADIPAGSVSAVKVASDVATQAELDANATASTNATNALKTNSSITTLGTVTAGNISHADIVYPSGHVIYHNHVQLSADSENAMNNTWLTVSNATITIPAATANICSKIVLQWSGHMLIYKGSAHHFAQLRCHRTTPNATTISIAKLAGTNEQGTGNPIYAPYTLICADASLSNADHTYILQKFNPSNFAGNVNGAASGLELSIWGIK